MKITTTTPRPVGTSRSPGRHRRWLATAAFSVVAVTLAACGSASSATSSPAATSASLAAVGASSAALSAPSGTGPQSAVSSGTTSLNSMLPAKIRDAGKITIGSELDFPPFEYMKTGTNTLVGFDVDVANAIGEKLGVKMDFVNANFSGLVAGVQAGRYDAAMSALADTADREKIVNFVNYGIASAGLLVQPGNPLNIKSLADMCGHSVAVQAGSVPAVPTTQAQSAACVKAGKPAIDMQTLQSGSDIYLALASKRVDIGFAGGPDAQYFLAQKPGAFDIVTSSKIVTGAFGIAVAKDNMELANALKAGMQAIIDDGSYAKIIAAWKLSTVGVTRTAINNTPAVFDKK